MSFLAVIATAIAPLVLPGGSSQAVAPEYSPAPVARYGPSELRDRVRELASRPTAERVVHWSEQFKGTPSWSPRADAEVADGLEFRRVDCETYVEQVIALAISRTWAEVRPLLFRIRYARGLPRPDLRHFTVVKGWLANAERIGILEDVTREVGRGAVRQVSKDLTPTSEWSATYRSRLLQLGPLAPKGVATITYLPLEAAARIIRKIPSGTLVHIVSSPHPRTPYLVTHVGFAIHTPWGVVFRHASQSPGRRKVEDRHFGGYLHYVARTPAGPERRTAIGVHLSRVREPRTLP